MAGHRLQRRPNLNQQPQNVDRTLAQSWVTICPALIQRSVNVWGLLNHVRGLRVLNGVAFHRSDTGHCLPARRYVDLNSEYHLVISPN